MKSKKVLATVLSVVMLVASLPCIVMADHETTEIEFPETTEVTLDLTEGVTSVIDRFDPGETKVVSFTPSSNGRYGFMCANGFDLSVSVTDQYGSAITPAETEKYNGNIITYLSLDAGMKYLFTISEYDSEDSYSENVRLLIGKSSKTLHLGTTYLFQETRTQKEVTFTPSESGVYVFNVSSQEKIDGRLILGDGQPVFNKDNSNSSVYFYATLTAGVTYPLILSLNYYTNPYEVCNPMKVTVTKDLPKLKAGRNPITLKADYQTSTYQFEPSEDAVYVIYSVGDCDTSFSMDGFAPDDNSGKGDNFSKGVCLSAGETYFPTFSKSGSSEELVEIYAEKATEITGTSTVYSLEDGDSLYYSYTPSKSGIYRYYSDISRINVRLMKFGSIDASIGTSYLIEGETYMIWVANDNSAGDIKDAHLYVEEITNTVSSGDSSIDNSKFERRVYALYSPQSSGKYTISIPVEYAGISVSTSRMQQIASIDPYTYQDVKAECLLEAGETYLLDVYLGDAGSSWQTVPLQITQGDLPELQVGDNPVLSDSKDTYYRFTPSESGMYQFCYEKEWESSPEIYDGAEWAQFYGICDYDYNAAFAMLEANKEYTIVMPRSYNGTSEPTLNISKVPQLVSGVDNQVNRPMARGYRSFYAQFTPEKSGIYTITNGSSKFYGLSVRTLDSYDSEPRVYDIDDLPHYLLEEGKTYFVTMTLTTAESPVCVSVTKDQALNVGTNSVHIPAPEDEDNPYAYFSFTAPAQGGYVFSFVNADLTDTALYAGLYSKTSNRFETSGYLHNGNPTVGNHLEKGETYRLRVKLDPNTNGEDLDIIIRAEYFYESKLDGYTLSLDGTIAVNLYMTLSEEMASSTSARMNITYENGATASYKMSDATPVTVTGKTYYVFHIPVAAKEMTSVIKAQIVDGEFEGNEYSFTVKDYADHILNGAYTSWGGVANQEYADAVPLVKALLNYGAYSQQYFGYKTDDLANKDLNDNDQILPTLNPNSIPGYNSNLTNLPSGVTFKSVSLSLESETELNLTFTNTTGKALSFTTDNEFVKLKVTSSGDQTKLKITGIPAHKVNEKIDLKVFLEGESDTYYVSYSPIYYCRNQIERPVSPTRTKALKDLMAAFYLYNQAARNYIDN